MLVDQVQENTRADKNSPKLSGEHNCQNISCIPKSGIAVSYDWIEFTGVMPKQSLPESTFLFSHKEAEHGTKQYNKLYKVSTIRYGEELEFAELQTQPRPRFLAKDLVQVKLANRICYTPDTLKAIEQFLNEYGIQFKNYTRLDIAIDFQEVAEYGNDIQKLMQAFAAKKLYLKSKSMKTHSLVSRYTGMTWGSRSSGVAATLYNKTEEMQKKSSKPWITDLWKEARFIEDMDVYRLEFSTTKPRVDIVDPETGITLGTYSEVNFLDRQKEYLNFLYQQHFQVAHYEEGVRFDRCKRYNLLGSLMEASVFRSVTACIKPQSTNRKKSFIKELVMAASFFAKEGDKVQASYTWELVSKYVEQYSLQKWFGNTYDRLQIKSTYMTHWDMVNSESIKFNALKQAKLVDFKV
jgi:hypothetical protein